MKSSGWGYGLEDPEWAFRTEQRVLKYIIRGYRLSWVDTIEGLVHEVRPGRFIRAIKEMKDADRLRFYEENPQEVANELQENWRSLRERSAALKPNNEPKEGGRRTRHRRRRHL